MISDDLVSTSRFIVLAIPVGVLAAALWSWRQGDGWWRALVRIALAVYAIVLVGLVFFPFPLPPWHVPGFDQPLYGAWPYPWANVVPFNTISVALGLGPDWPEFQLLVGNLAAFVPLGVFIGCLWPGRHSWRRAAAIGLAISAGVELSQLGLSLLMGYPYRVADVDDVIVNVSGVLLGYGLFRAADAIGRAILPSRLVFWA